MALSRVACLTLFRERSSASEGCAGTLRSADFLEPRCCGGLVSAADGPPSIPPGPRQAPLLGGALFSGARSNSGSLAMVAAIVLASSLVMR